MRAFANPLKERAALLLAERRFDYAEVALRIGITVRTLWTWRRDATFKERVAEIAAELSEAAMGRAIGNKAYRIKVLADKHSDLLAVIEARAADPEMGKVPGGSTGLLVRKVVASAGKHICYEYAVDTPLLKELRGIQEQAAEELGQIVSKREITGKDGVGLFTAEFCDALLADDQ